MYFPLLKGLLLLRRFPFRGLLHKFVYGRAVGHNVSIGQGAVIIGENVRIGNDVKIGENVKIFAKEIDIADEVCIDSGTEVDCNYFKIGIGSWIWKDCILEGIPFRNSRVEIGNFVWIQNNSFLDTTAGIFIDDFAAVGGHSKIWTHYSLQSRLEGYPAKFSSTAIKRNAYVGWDSQIMPGVTVNSKATTGIGSIVCRDVPEDCLAMGNDGRIIKNSMLYSKNISREDKEAVAVEILEGYAGLINESFNLKRFIKNKKIRAEKNSHNLITVYAGNDKLKIFLISEKIQNSSVLSELGDRDKTIVIALQGVGNEHDVMFDGFFGFIDLQLYIFKFSEESQVIRDLIDSFWCYGIPLVKEKYKAYALGASN